MFRLLHLCLPHYPRLSRYLASWCLQFWADPLSFVVRALLKHPDTYVFFFLYINSLLIPKCNLKIVVSTDFHSICFQCCGSQLWPASVWLPTFFKISYFVFNRRKILIQLWNNLRFNCYNKFWLTSDQLIHKNTLTYYLMFLLLSYFELLHDTTWKQHIIACNTNIKNYRVLEQILPGKISVLYY